VLFILCAPGGITYKPRHSANAWEKLNSGLVTKLTRQSLFGFRRTFLVHNEQFGIQAHCSKDAQVISVPRDSGVLSQSQSHILTAWHYLAKSILLSSPSFPMVTGVHSIQSPGDILAVLRPSHSLCVLHRYLEGDSSRGFVFLLQFLADTRKMHLS